MSWPVAILFGLVARAVGGEWTVGRACRGEDESRTGPFCLVLDWRLGCPDRPAAWAEWLAWMA